MAMYIRWDAENSTHIGVPSNVPGDEGDWLQCVPPKEPMSSPSQQLKWLYLEGTHEDYLHGYWEGSADPLDCAASIDQIKAAQEAFEYEPIEVFGVVLDCDARSEKLMQDAIDTWDLRPDEPDWFETIGEVKVLYWKAQNNSKVALTKEQLIATYQQMKVNRAIRAQKLWAKAQQFKSTSCTLRQIETIEHWLA